MRRRADLPQAIGVVSVRPRLETEGAKSKTAPVMNEQTQTTPNDPLINLLFEDGLQNALPRIAEILMNATMLIERERHIGAAPHQRGVERNGYRNGLVTFFRSVFCGMGGFS